MIARYQSPAALPATAGSKSRGGAKTLAGAKVTQTDHRVYDTAVAEAKRILAQMEANQNRRMRLGELADKVEARYGGQSLKRFASDIGIAACTLARCRSVFRAWSGKKAPAPKSYAVAQELQSHPQRFELVRQTPNMTKRQARAHMRRLRSESGQENFAVHLLKEEKRWFRSVVRHASEAIRDAAIVDGELSPQVQQALRESVELTLLPTLREAGDAFTRLAVYLERLAVQEEPPEPDPQLLEAAE